MLTKIINFFKNLFKKDSDPSPNSLKPSASSDTSPTTNSQTTNQISSVASSWNPDFLEQARDFRNKTQTEVAAALNISRSSYQRLENNPREITLGELENFAQFLDLDLYQLLHSKLCDQNPAPACPPTCQKISLPNN